MPVTISDIETSRIYIHKVMANANHHANRVSKIVPALLGYLMAYDDEDNFKVRPGKTGSLGHLATVLINGEKYTFSYDHEDKSVKAYKNGKKDQTVGSFNNDTTVAELSDFFESLKPLKSQLKEQFFGQ